MFLHNPGDTENIDPDIIDLRHTELEALKFLH